MLTTFFALKHWPNILLITGFVFTAIAGLSIAYLALHPIGTSTIVIGTVEEKGIRNTYACEDGSSFTVLFVDNLAKVNLPDGRKAVLPHANRILRSEYDRYANASHTFAFSHDVHGAFFEERGIQIHHGCEVVATENLLS